MPASISSLTVTEDPPSVTSIVLNAGAVGATLGFCNGMATGAISGIAGAVIGAVAASVAAVQPQASSRGASPHPATPDGRYFAVRGRLWRKANPDLSPERSDELVRRLMAARRAMKRKGIDPVQRQALRDAVDNAKRALGERGAPWWDDGAPDYNRHLVKNTPYADWHAALPQP